MDGVGERSFRAWSSGVLQSKNWEAAVEAALLAWNMVMFRCMRSSSSAMRMPFNSSASAAASSPPPSSLQRPCQSSPPSRPGFEKIPRPRRSPPSRTHRPRISTPRPSSGSYGRESALMTPMKPRTWPTPLVASRTVASSAPPMRFSSTGRASWRRRREGWRNAGTALRALRFDSAKIWV